MTQKQRIANEMRAFLALRGTRQEDFDKMLHAYAEAHASEDRADIVAWMRKSPERMREQAIHGAQSIGALYDCGQLAAADGLANAIEKRAYLSATREEPPESQPTCTGAEFVEAAQSALAGRTEDELEAFAAGEEKLEASK